MKAFGEFGAAFCCIGTIFIVIGCFTFMLGDTTVITLGTFLAGVGIVMVLVEMAWDALNGRL